MLPNKTIIIALCGFVVAILTITSVVVYFGNKGQRPIIVIPTPQLQKAPPPPISPRIKSATEIKTSKAYTVTFNIPNPQTFPTTIEGIGVTRNMSVGDAQKIADTFNITTEPTRISENTYLWSNKPANTTLLINSHSGYIDYQNNQTPTKSDPGGTQTKMVSVGDAQKIAEKTLTTLGAITIVPGAVFVKKYQRPSEQLVEATNEYNLWFYEFSYRQSFKGTQIYQQLGTPSTITVWVDKYGKVIRLNYFNIQPNSVLSLNIKPFAEIEESIKDNEGTIVSIDGQSTQLSISSVSITSATLGYFDNKIDTTLSPVFIFSGEAQTSLGKRKIILYIPAY